MVGWHHRLKGYEFEQTLGDGEGRENMYLPHDSAIPFLSLYPREMSLYKDLYTKL